MAQTTILAAGTSADTSSDVSVAAGANAIFALLAASVPPDSIQLAIVIAITGGAEAFVGYLGNEPVVVTNPSGSEIVYRVKREDVSGYGLNVGAVAIT